MTGLFHAHDLRRAEMIYESRLAAIALSIPLRFLHFFPPGIYDRTRFFHHSSFYPASRHVAIQLMALI